MKPMLCPFKRRYDTIAAKCDLHPEIAALPPTERDQPPIAFTATGSVASGPAERRGPGMPFVSLDEMLNDVSQIRAAVVRF